MQVILEFSLIPIGVGVSLSEYIAACQQIFEEAGLSYELHANGTNIEGDWENVFAAIKQCHETLHQHGVPRISSQIKAGTRIDRNQSMGEKVISVEKKLAESR